MKLRLIYFRIKKQDRFMQLSLQKSGRIAPKGRQDRRIRAGRINYIKSFLKHIVFCCLSCRRMKRSFTGDPARRRRILPPNEAVAELGDPVKKAS